MKQRILNIYFKILGSLAHHYLKKYKPLVIGINGSVGKTSCRMVVTQTLQQFLPNKHIVTSPRNFNGELGLSLSIFEITSWEPKIFTFINTLCKVAWMTFFGKCNYDIIVLEYGIDRPKEMDFLLSIVKPDIGIFTAIDAVHSEQFGNPQEIAREEIKMVRNTKSTVFLNSGDPYAMEVSHLIDVDKFYYQTAEPISSPELKEDIYFDSASFILNDQRTPELEANITIKGKTIKIRTNLLSKENLGYIGVALTIAEIIGQKGGNKLLHQLSKENNVNLLYTLQAGRLSVFEGVSETLLFDSSYNASPLSMRSIITTVRSIKMKCFPERPLWLVLGDMRELGTFSESEHRKLAAYVSQVADHVFLVGDYMTKHMADELEKIGYPMSNVCKFHNAHTAATIIKKLIIDAKHPCDDHNHHHHPEQPPLLVFKGSQNTIFLEEAVKFLLKDPKDEKHLTRQGARWAKKKESL